MHRLSRTVRLSIHPDASGDADEPRDNTFAGWPSMRGVGAYYEMVVTCAGVPDEITGYVLDIAQIDAAVRSVAIEPLRAALSRSTADPLATLSTITREIDARLDGAVQTVQWRLTPYYSIAMQPSHPHHALLRQMFDFAASHRLAVPSFSDEQNRKIFGKCSHPSGHGHNYKLEAAVQVSMSDEPAGGRFTLRELEEIVKERILDRFDHRNLNEDLPEFSTVLPTVENIARVCFNLLDDPITTAGGHLASVTVWETDRTSSSYSRPVTAATE